MSEVLLAEAILGRDAEEFEKSELGRYLLGRAEQEENEALNALADVSADDTKAVRDLQAKAWRARSFKTWIRELIAGGKTAESQLSELETEP